MEQPKYLIDSTAVIDYLARKLPTGGMNFMNTLIDAIHNTSVITKIEVLSFNTDEEHTILFNNFMNDAVVMDLTSNFIMTSINVRKNIKQNCLIRSYRST